SILYVRITACGLYYLAELIEEHTITARRLIKHITLSIVVTQILLWLVDAFPLPQTLFTLFCHLWYSQLLRSFPVIELSSIAFMGSCLLVIVDHFVWFFWFVDRRFTFGEIASFFGVCVWLVPFLYFISLSANEYTLP
ncbi:transmembrane adaptor Erv26, partial [Gaertneriomyces semiglobifer]